MDMSQQTGAPADAAGAPARLSSLVAPLIAIVAAGAAVAAGHLVAVFAGVRSSPFVALGNSVRDLSPPALTNWAIESLGEWKKTILFIGIAVVMLIVAAVAGRLSARSALPGTIIIAAFGVAGGVAVFFEASSQLALLAPLASIVVGVGVFRWLHARALAAVESDEQPVRPEHDGASRRSALLAGGGVAVGAAAVGIGSQLVISSQSAASSRMSVRQLRSVERAAPVPRDAAFTKLGTPPFITPNSEFYRVDTVVFKVPQIRAAEWQLRIHGMVDDEIAFSYADIRAMPLVERTITQVCVSNPVGGRYISTTKYVGVELRELLRRAGVRRGAEQLFSTSSDGFTVGTPVETVLEKGRGALLAIGMNDEPLPFEHGFPARMVVPGLYGYVSATKWVVDMELTTWQARTAYWLERGWAREAPIKTESRIDQPAGFETVSAGRVTVAGVAWHPHVGIRKVEVRLDDGPWQEAALGAEYNIDTWRMWHTTFGAAPGSHHVTVRATDKSGYTQTKERAGTVPDGATGRHTVAFTAR